MYFVSCAFFEFISKYLRLVVVEWLIMCYNLGNFKKIFMDNSDKTGQSGLVQKDTMGDVERALKSADQGKVVDIGGEKVLDPKKAYETLQSALNHVSRYLNFDKNDISFRKFSGSTVGEATAEGVEIDPIMLMHPVNRLAQVITHEFLHKKGGIENEGLVEAATVALLKASGLYSEEGGLKMTKNYTFAVENFKKFIARVSEGEDENKVLLKVYDLYYSGKYNEIYRMYENKYLNGFPDEKDRAKEFLFFKNVFPEFEVHSPSKDTFDTDGKFYAREELGEAIDKWEDAPVEDPSAKK
jgi:hypothetical protein